jgi:hypothetical protein
MSAGMATAPQHHPSPSSAANTLGGGIGRLSLGENRRINQSLTKASHL